MIENLRKYTGLIIVLFVLVLIGFLLMDTSSMRTGGVGGVPYIKVAGRTYTDKEFSKLGASAYQVSQSLSSSMDSPFLLFIMAMMGDARSQELATQNFFANRMLLRAAKEEFGIYPGEEEIDSFIRKIRSFTGPNGEFSQEQYREFIEKRIGRLGLTEGDIRELASDVIAQTKLAEILGAGLTTNRDTIAKKTALSDQRIALNVARLDRKPIEEKIDPSEEDIKAYWETVQDAFKTPEKRKFTYLIAKPTIPTPDAEIPAPAADATEEAKAEYEKAKAAREGKIADERRKAQLKIDGEVDKFVNDFVDNKEANFEKLAKDNIWELKTTELFAQDDAPADLKIALRSTSIPGTAVDELFRMVVTSDPLSKISPAIAIGEGEWLIAQLDETEKVRVKTYEEARADARTRLIGEKANTALKTATEEAVEKIKTALSGGKTFLDAAKEAGITNETVSLPEVTAGYQGDTTKVPSNLFESAKHTDPGALTEPIIESDRTFIIHIEKREVVKQENADAALDSEVKSAESEIRIKAFKSWLAAKTEAASVEILQKQ